MAFLDVDLTPSGLNRLSAIDHLTHLVDRTIVGDRLTSFTVASSLNNRYTMEGDFEIDGSQGTVSAFLVTDRNGNNLISLSELSLSREEFSGLGDQLVEQSSLQGDDRLFMSSGSDSIHGYAGNDLIYGGGALVVTEDGDDTLTGGSGADSIYGNAGDDFLVGGDDYLDFDDAADTISGGLGNDLLAGAGGNDNLTGGLGDDIFVLTPNAGSDTIMDFTPGQDIISIQGTGYQILGTDGSHSFLQTDTGTGVLLLWTTPDELQESDFFYWS